MIDNSIAQRARTPKGRRTLQAILDATYELVSSEGLAAASQEAVAKRAGLTQSAVRHYFPKKGELLDAFFMSSIERLEEQFKRELSQEDKDPRSRLVAIAALHYDRVLEVEDVAYFEIASTWARNERYRAVRDGWYRRLSSYYRELLQAIHPDWDRDRRDAVVFQVITLILGGWASMGSSRPIFPGRGRKALKAILIEGIERLID
jgi:AcrR family transcriptional regulator